MENNNPLQSILSPDHNAERLSKLKELFPDLFTVEGELDTRELEKLANPNDLREIERYEFRWFGKSQAKRNAFTPTNATFVFDEARSVNPENSENIIIEGDNLDSLKLLSSAYREKIKCIYIDPPYNTGKDFVYSDNFTQDKKAYWEDAGIVENGVKIDTNTETDGRFHSNWLNMMYSRLLIARQLLREDGVIFISIDDNEVHHLRKLCDEVFGEENFVGELIWKSRQNKDNRNITGLSSDHEYIICYSKNNGIRVLKGTERKVEQYSNPDNDERGSWVSGNMVGLLGEDLRPNCHYDLINPETGINYGKPKLGWRYDQNTMSRLIKEKRILWPENSEGRPRRKVFLLELNSEMPNFTSIVGDNLFTRDGTKEIDEIFGSKYFDFPKPSKLIAEVIDQAISNEDIILDFFAGSGTTGQAVMELNKDGGNRKFILVQLPEQTDEKSEAHKNGFKKISDITIERNKRVVEKIVKEKAEKQPDLFNGENHEVHKGLGFKVFKLTKSNFPRAEFAPDPQKSDEENIADLKKYIAEKESQLVTAFNREELITEILVKRGFSLNYKTVPQPQFTKNEILLATDGYKEALISLDVEIADETVEYFKTHTTQKLICLERALNTTKKFNLKHYLGEGFDAF